MKKTAAKNSKRRTRRMKRQAAMTFEEAFYDICFFGDACIAPAGEHEMRALCAEVVTQLPNDVQTWVLHETSHLFIAGSGQDGEFIHASLPAAEVRDALVFVRIIFLSERLMKAPKDDALWTIAHEI